MITKEQLEWYQKEALRTFEPADNDLEVAALGLAGECAETLRGLRYFAEEGKDELAKELGDLCWYIAVSFHLCDLDFEFASEQLWNEKLPQGSILEDYLDLVEEVGFYCDLVKKKIGHGHSFAPKETLRDIVKAFALVVHGLKIDIFTLMQLNSAKLRQRYPDGFSHEASINRTC